MHWRQFSSKLGRIPDNPFHPLPFLPFPGPIRFQAKAVNNNTQPKTVDDIALS